MCDKIKNAFALANCIDNARWISPNGGQALVKNFFVCPKSITNDEERAEYIILTHWLTYICERQMRYERIWTEGSYIFSAMVRDYQNKDNDIDKTFIKRYLDVVDGHLKFKTADSEKTFSSRFMSADCVSIFRTLKTLKEKQKETEHTGLYNYLQQIETIDMHKLLYNMYLLSYYNVGQPDLLNMKNDKNINTSIESVTDEILKCLDNRNNELDLDKYIAETIFHSKRTICAVRDYFKFEKYKSEFKHLLGKDTFVELGKELNKLELPGDVWNNNSKFGKCMEAIGFDYGIAKTQKYLNRSLRNAYKEIFEGYPEQFDFTFDFAPRMCEKGKCSICLFKYISKPDKFDYNVFDSYCVQKDNKICPVMLQYCGYIVNCKTAKEKGACLLSFKKSIDNQGR